MFCQQQGSHRLIFRFRSAKLNGLFYQMAFDLYDIWLYCAISQCKIVQRLANRNMPNTRKTTHELFARHSYYIERLNIWPFEFDFRSVTLTPFRMLALKWKKVYIYSCTILNPLIISVKTRKKKKRKPRNGKKIFRAYFFPRTKLAWAHQRQPMHL